MLMTNLTFWIKLLYKAFEHLKISKLRDGAISLCGSGEVMRHLGYFLLNTGSGNHS